MPKTRKTKNLAVYEKLKQGIISGELQPGQKLVMASLARAFGCSETPMREAIRRLESDGFVIFTPHSGAMVTMMDDQELSEIYLIRISLEALATRLAGPYIGKADIDWLKKKNTEMKAAVKKRRYEDLARLNKAFHLRIYQAAPFPRLSRLINDLWDAFERWPSVFTYVPERGLTAVREHDEIIAALEKNDIDAADMLMTEQKKQAMKALQNYMIERNAASPERMEIHWQKQKNIKV